MEVYAESVLSAEMMEMPDELVSATLRGWWRGGLCRELRKRKRQMPFLHRAEPFAAVRHILPAETGHPREEVGKLYERLLARVCRL
jgi:hypothetical protein